PGSAGASPRSPAHWAGPRRDGGRGRCSRRNSWPEVYRSGGVDAATCEVGAALHEQFGVVLGVVPGHDEPAALIEAAGRGIRLDHREANRDAGAVLVAPLQAASHERPADALPPRLGSDP